MSNKANNSLTPQQYIRSQGYTYFAFISYRHLDKKWAIWLKRKLQSYRLPVKTHEQYSDLPSRISPIFLDRDNMRSGELKKLEREEVQSSKFLIVICSKNAFRHSDNIDDEIHYFIEGGGDLSHIIPFVIDQSEHPEEECFPAKLQELYKAAASSKKTSEHKPTDSPEVKPEEKASGKPVVFNIHDFGKNDAFLKVVAKMHGIKSDELEAEEKIRRKKHRIINTAVAAVLAVAMCAAAYYCWDYYVPKRHYYLDYTEVYGLPKGIGELQRAETKSLNQFFTIVSRGGKIRELRLENAYGQIVISSWTKSDDGAIHAVYGYTDDGTLSTVTHYDANDNPIGEYSYSGANLKTIDLRNHVAENSSDYDRSTSLSAHSTGWLSTNSDQTSQNGNVMRYLVDYDEDGYVKEIRYACNTMNYVAADADGVSGVRFERDEWGRVIRESYLIFTGEGKTAENPEDYEIIGSRTGVAAVEYDYDGFDGVETRFLDVSGKLTTGFLSVCVDRLEYKDHNVVKSSYYDADGRPMFSSGGYASYEAVYDDHGNEIRESYCGTDGELVMLDDGYAFTESEFDDCGNIIRLCYYGTDGTPVTNSDGYASFERTYDANRNPIKISFFGVDGSPVMHKDGYSSSVLAYDDRGNATYQAFFGTDGAPVLINEGYACVKIEYNKQDLEIKDSYFGTDGNPVLSSIGNASWEFEYDEWENKIKASAFGIRGEPVVINDGYSYWECEYTNRGSIRRMCSYGTDGEPVLSKNGYAAVEIDYDDWGNEIGKRFYGADGKPVIINDGFASFESEFDNRGNVIKMTFYGTDDAPILTGSGYAAATCEYDKRGNRTKLSCYGVDGRPILSAAGYAVMLKEYNDKGKEIRSSYYGIDGEPTLIDNGYASNVTEYDERGNSIRLSYYDTKGDPVLTADGYASVKQEYDERGGVTKMSFFGTDDKLLINAGGYAVMESEYDERGNEIRRSYYGADDQLIMSSEGFAYAEVQYDEKGSPVSLIRYDADGNIIE